ncbi:phasin family protein [uncultured Massilia sp.]|uniref:phasin family protein n=1 Tax=uncultured Massilia sp. TaxID=169973 RepID=UPI0025DB1F55|nr:phasin family protein [uncultured Massilia sp.]
MTPFSEQLSAVRKSQWEAQLKVLDAIGSRALDNAEQLIALNMKTSRASMEQAAGTLRQMLDARDPRDLLAVGAAAQRQWQHLFSYGRELLGIATGVRAVAWDARSAPVLAAPLQLLPAASANVPVSAPQALEQAAIAAADATTVTTEIAAAALDTGSALAEAALHAAGAPAPAPAPVPESAPEPDGAPVPDVTELDAEKTGAVPSETPRAAADAANAVDAVDAVEAPVRGAATAAVDAAEQAEQALEQAIADEAPLARAKPLAAALGKVAPKPAGAEHPIASTVPLEAGGHVDLPIVTPVESTPPLHVPARDTRSTRASRKK